VTVDERELRVEIEWEIAESLRRYVGRVVTPRLKSEVRADAVRAAIGVLRRRGLRHSDGLEERAGAAADRAIREVWP